jgi:hypothetical protein
MAAINTFFTKDFEVEEYATCYIVKGCKWYKQPNNGPIVNRDEFLKFVDMVHKNSREQVQSQIKDALGIK